MTKRLFGDSPEAAALTGTEDLAARQSGSIVRVTMTRLQAWVRGWLASADIKDATGTGRGLMTAADALAARVVLGSENVANLAPADLPISTAQQTALNLKAPLANPGFTGNPTVPTQVVATSNTRAASTAFVYSVLAAYGPTSTTMPTAADANAVTQTGMWRLATTSTNGPTAAASYNVLHMAYAASAAQTQLAVSATTSSLGRTFVRGWASGTGSGAAWNELAAVSFANTWTALQTYSLPVKLAPYTLTTLPSAATYSGGYITVTNATGGAALCYSNGTNWINTRTNATVA